MCKLDPVVLNGYIDDTLDPLEKMALEEHLKLCPECRRELNRLKLVDWDMRKFYNEDDPIPPELSCYRESVLQACFEGEAGTEEFTFTFRDMLNLQVSSFKNTIKFFGFMPGLIRAEKSPAPAIPQKRSVLRRIIGL